MDSESFTYTNAIGIVIPVDLPPLAVTVNPLTPFTPQTLAKQILVQLEMFPETHAQADFVAYGNCCGTKMCVAGWAQFLRYGQVDMSTVVEDAAELLGLDWNSAVRLFYNTSDEEAVEALELIANGQPLDQLF